MVLIEPRIEHVPSDPYGGRLVVKVPHTSGDKILSVPLNPSPEILTEWSMYVFPTPCFPLLMLNRVISLNDCNLFKIVYMDGYICQPISPSDSTPTEVLSEYFGQRVYLMMKGPDPRECAPTQSFPELKATAEFHVRQTYRYLHSVLIRPVSYRTGIQYSLQVKKVCKTSRKLSDWLRKERLIQ